MRDDSGVDDDDDHDDADDDADDDDDEWRWWWWWGMARIKWRDGNLTIKEKKKDKKKKEINWLTSQISEISCNHPSIPPKSSALPCENIIAKSGGCFL